MVFVIASIAFFLTSIRSVLFWTLLWQKNGYRIKSVSYYIRHLPKKDKAKLFLSASIYIFFLLLYIFVIFNDSFTTLYQAGITLVLVLRSVGFLKEILTASVKKPYFSLKALVISLLSTFTISCIYAIPLVDSYLWIIFLLLFVPILVGGFVAILAFPSELYEDYISQKLLKKIHAQLISLQKIAVFGKESSEVIKYFSAFFNESVQNTNGFLSIVKIFQKKIIKKSSEVLFEMPNDSEEIKKLSQLPKLNICIITSDIYDIKKCKEMLHTFSKQTIILSYTNNIFFNEYVRKHEKKIFLYGLQKSFKGTKVAVFATSTNIAIGKKHISLRGLGITSEDILHILPCVYIALKKNYSLRKIRNILAYI